MDDKPAAEQEARDKRRIRDPSLGPLNSQPGPL